jgi:hypothetical protein
MDDWRLEKAMGITIVRWGALAGLVHFLVIGALYGNPFVDGMYRAASENSAVKRWVSKPRYLVTQFLGTQVEVYILTLAFVWLRPMVGLADYVGPLALGAVLALIRVYPRFWNMWIQTTYPNRLLAVEAINGTIGTLVIVFFLHAVTR